MSEKVAIRLAGGHPPGRRGVILPLTVVLLIVFVGFVAFAVDTGNIGDNQIKHQNALDAASLAAAQEIQVAIKESAASVSANPELSVQEQLDAINAAAVQRATEIAINVAASNGVTLNESDVEFGKQTINENGEIYQDFESAGPYNLVRITSNRSQGLFFAPALGIESTNLQTISKAYIESRDIVLVQDYSGSMAWDSGYSGLYRGIPIAQIEENLDDSWLALADPVDEFGDPESPIYFKSTTTPKFPAVTTEGERVYGDVTVGEGTALSSYTTFTPSIIASFTSNVLNTNPPLDKNSLTAANVAAAISSENMSELGDRIDDVFDHDSGEAYDVVDALLDMDYGDRIAVINAVTEHIDNGTDWSWNSNGRKNVYYELDSWDRSWWLAKTIGLLETSGGTPVVPFPQVGKNSSGVEYSMKSSSSNADAWTWYVYRTLNSHSTSLNNVDGKSSYWKHFGTRTLVAYLLYWHQGNDEIEDFWRTPHYPFHGMKRGTTMLLDFLDGLQFGDQVGIVSYAGSSSYSTSESSSSYSRLEAGLSDDYDQLQGVHYERQAAHYTPATGMGFGINRAIDHLLETGRPGAQRVVCVLTDGMANSHYYYYTPLTDEEMEALTNGYDGEGTSYSPSVYDDGSIDGKKYAMAKVADGVDEAIVFHTMSVGDGADTDMMKAMAYAGHGVYYHIPGISSATLSEEVIAEIQAVFAQIAASVPTVKLLIEEE